MADRVYITAFGIISSLGMNILENLDSLRNLKSGIGEISTISTIHKNMPVGEIKFTDKELCDLAKIMDKNKIYTRTSLLAIIAAKEALSNCFEWDNSPIRTGIVSATTVGGMSNGEDHYIDYLQGKSTPVFLETFDCGDSTEAVADYFGIKQYQATISTACSSSANSIILGSRLIKNNKLDRVIVGGTDALSKFTINGFNSLEILDTEPCKPFDENRHGLNLGEAAAYLILESENTANPDSIICEFKGYGTANDAYHQTASSPDGFGAWLAMHEALKNTGLKPKDINYINAHGTGTEINDLSEGKAIEKLFSPVFPFISSTKVYTGHTLGAAGAVEAVISVLSIKYGLVFPNLNWKTKMKELPFSPFHGQVIEADVINVMSNSFGFGGNNSSLVFSKC